MAAYTELLKNLSTEGIPPEVLERLAQTAGKTRDQLTGLIDYRSFSLQLEEDLQSVDSGVLITLSIDYLQELNLVSGWVVGDIALCTVANLIKELPFPNSLSGKVSGGTFVTFLASSNLEQVKEWIKGIQTKLAEVELPGMDILPEEHLTISCGLYQIPADKKNADNALLETKKRLKFAQSEGGNRIATVADQNIDLEDQSVDIKCFAKRQGSREWFDVALIQLNIHGLSFESAEPHMVREEIQIKLTFGNHKLTLQGDVGWRRSASSDSEHQFNIGVKFKPLNDEQVALLERLMG